MDLPFKWADFAASVSIPNRFAEHLGLSESLVAGGKNESLPVGTASYSEELADKVYSLYRTDFEVLRYDRNTWAAGGRKSSQQPKKGSICISEEKLIDEIIERNLIILSLYEERERLQTQLKWVSRLHLPPVISGLVALHSISRKAAQIIKGSALRVLRRRNQMQKAMLP